jgi:hypothetical protein
MIGDGNLSQLLQKTEIEARAAALEYETQQGDYSIFGWKDTEDYHNTYQPFQALQR